jgi:cyclopropane-fatty-acyl-phospholipid synthase
VTTPAARHLYEGASVEAIRHHYDAGNDFYRLWLDPTLTYSCGMWETGEDADALESAQRRKVDYHIAQARARDAHRVLDIGCGWGWLLKRLVQSHNVREAVGLTLSDAQAEWIQSFADDRVCVRLENWFDHLPDRPYDAIVSIEAFEAFAKPGMPPNQKIEAYRAFFSKCHQILVAGGFLSLQTIAWGDTDRNRTSQFIETEIFPESDLPDLAEIAEASERLFEVVTIRSDCEDYERTCRAWLTRLESARERAIDSVGGDAFGRYAKYLKIATIGFHLRRLQLLRIAFRKIDEPRA